MPPENDPHCPIQEFVVAIITPEGHADKANQLIFGMSKYSRNSKHMEFRIPSQTIGDCVYRRAMHAHVDCYCEGSLRGHFYKPLAMAGVFTFRRFGTLRGRLPNELVALILQASPCYKDGSKLVKLIYVDINQLAQFILAFESAAYDGPCMQQRPWIDEGELMQVHRVIDLTEPHVTTYVRPTRDQDMTKLYATESECARDEDELFNDDANAVEASVNAFTNQLAHVILNTEPPLQNTGLSTMQLTRQHLAPSNPDSATWQSTRHRLWAVYYQPKPKMWSTRYSDLCLHIDQSKTLDTAVIELGIGQADSTTANLRSRAVVEQERKTLIPQTPLRDTVGDPKLVLGNLYPCSSQYDRGPNAEDYEDNVLVINRELQIPLELGYVGEQYPKWLCNFYYSCLTYVNQHHPPMETLTSVQDVVALTMHDKICPFIVSESPSDMEGNVTLLLSQADVDLFYNKIKMWTHSYSEPPMVQLNMNMAEKPGNWNHPHWDDVCLVKFDVTLFTGGEEEFQATYGTLGLKHIDLSWPNSGQKVAQAYMLYTDWEPWRSMFFTKLKRTPSANLPCLRKSAFDAACAAEKPDWTMYPKLEEPTDYTAQYSPDTRCFVLESETRFWKELVGHNVYIRGVDHEDPFLDYCRYNVQAVDLGRTPSFYKGMWYYTDAEHTTVDWHQDYKEVIHDVNQPLSYQFCQNTLSPEPTPVSDASLEVADNATGPTQPVEPAPGLAAPGLPQPKKEEKKEVKDTVQPKEETASSSSQRAPPVSTTTTPVDTRAAGRDEVEEGTQASSKRRQVVLRFAITYKTVNEEVRLPNGDVNTSHPNIAVELGRKLSDLDIAGRYKKRSFKEKQDHRTRKRGEPKDNGRIVYLEIVCDQKNATFIKDKLFTDRKHRFRLYGGTLTLDSESSQSDSEASSSSYSYDTSSSHDSGQSEHEPSSPPDRPAATDRRAASPSKRARRKSK